MFDKMATVDSGNEKKPVVSPYKHFTKHAARSTVFLVLFAWLNACWIFSSAYEQSDKAKNLDIIALDLDQSVLGTSMLLACESISGQNGVTSFHQRDITMEEAYDLVWKGHVWGAIIAMPNATDNFVNAVKTGDSSYDSSTAITYIWNEVRWATTQESYITPSYAAAIDATSTIVFDQLEATNAFANTSLSTPGMRILVEGLSATSKNIQPFPIGARPFLSTAAMVFPALLEFFFSMAVRAAIHETNWGGPISVKKNYLAHIGAAFIYSCIHGVSWGLWIEVFHEHSGISGGQYCLIWLTFWMYGIIAFLVYDTATAALPHFAFPPLVLTYIIINVTAAANPINVKPNFFHLDYIWPSYNCFELFVTIFSHGSTSRVYRNVPVLFGWIVFWAPVHWWANKRKCEADAVKPEETQEEWEEEEEDYV